MMKPDSIKIGEALRDELAAISPQTKCLLTNETQSLEQIPGHGSKS